MVSSDTEHEIKRENNGQINGKDAQTYYNICNILRLSPRPLSLPIPSLPFFRDRQRPSSHVGRHEFEPQLMVADIEDPVIKPAGRHVRCCLRLGLQYRQITCFLPVILYFPLFLPLKRM